MDKYGYVDVFPTRIHKIKLDTKILPKITFEEKNHSNVVDILHNSNEITVDVAINPGNSGGPNVNTKGQLVAVAVSGMSKDVTEGINFGIKASAAPNFLK